jgi:hypothetical protein
MSLLAIFINTRAYGQFKVDAQIRPRIEVRDGYQKLAHEGAIPAVFISQRTRLNIGYENDWLKLRIAPQDVRIWGDEHNVTLSGNAGDTASFDLYEAFAEIRISQSLSLKAGRQQISYDNDFLLEKGNWNQYGNASDAVVLKFGKSGWNIHAGSAWNTLTESFSDNLFPTDRYKSLSFLWVNREISGSLKGSLLHVATGRTQTDTTNRINFRHTTGVYAAFTKEKIDAWGNFYYQYGKSQPGKPVSAFLFTADIKYKTDLLSPGAGMAYVSGNKETGAAQTKDHLFDLIYTSRHTYFGFMDYFKTFTSHTKQGGLADFYYYLDFRMSKAASIRNTGHYFILAQTNPSTPAEKNLGYENDLVLKYKFNDWAAMEAGYLFFLPTESLKTIQGVQDDKFSQFLYLQLTLTPELFKQQIQQ